MSCRPHDDTQPGSDPHAFRGGPCGYDPSNPPPLFEPKRVPNYRGIPMPRQWPDDGRVEPPRRSSRVFAVVLLLGVALAVAALVFVQLSGGFGDLWTAGGAR